MKFDIERYAADKLLVESRLEQVREINESCKEWLDGFHDWLIKNKPQTEEK